MPAAFLFPVSLALDEVSRLVAGISDATIFDRISFDDESGGDADQQLAIPFLSDMDEVVTDDAHVRIRAVSKPIDISGYKLSRPSGNNQGILLELNDVQRLLEVEFTGSPLPPLSGSPSLRFVVRPITPNGFGPPIFAQPSFNAPGSGTMFGRVLAGLSYRASASDRFIIGFPSLSGKQWLFQLATGDDPTSLTPTAFGPNLTRVAIDAAPKNLSLVLASNPPIPLWSHPGALLPEAGVQDISFTPLAQQHLAKALASSQVALAVPLRFHSDSAGAIGITGKALVAHYVARPLAADPLKLRLTGTWTKLSLNAPAGKRPSGSSFDLSAQLLGRELNAGSPIPDPELQHDGVRVFGTVAIATSVPFLPRDGDSSGNPLNLASVNLYLFAPQDAEIVLEIRPDVAGIPGPPASAPIVKQIAKGFAGWSEFLLAKALPVVPGGAPVWIAVRVNKGEAFWFGGGTGPVRSSADRGETWSATSHALSTMNPPLVQLFHELPAEATPATIPVQVRLTDVDAGRISLSSPAGSAAWAAKGYALPSNVLARLQAVPGSGRKQTDLLLFSRVALVLTVNAGALRYD